MVPKEILVYDNQHGFSRLLKKHFENIVDFRIYKKIETNRFENLQENFAIIFFIIYSEEDLFDFIQIHDKGVPIVVCSFYRHLLAKFNNVDDVILLKNSLTKRDLLNQFQTAMHTHAVDVFCA